AEVGETLQIEDAAYTRFLGFVKKWFCLNQFAPGDQFSEYLEDQYSGRYKIRFNWTPIAKNRYGKAIAASYFYQLFRLVTRSTPIGSTELVVATQPERQSGSLVLLP